MSNVTVSAKSIARLAYGYELMFSTLCKIAGTSGGSPHWFTNKGIEAIGRVDPLWKLNEDSNAHKPGDCLSQHEPFAKWAADAEKRAEALDHWRHEVGKLHSQIATKDEELAKSNAELDRLRRECRDGLDALSDIDDFWGACPYPDNRKHLSPAEKISSLDNELNKAHDEIARIKAAINWCIERDDKNGSLPEAYREKLLAAAE